MGDPRDVVASDHGRRTLERVRIAEDRGHELFVAARLLELEQLLAEPGQSLLGLLGEQATELRVLTVALTMLAEIGSPASCAPTPDAGRRQEQVDVDERRRLDRRSCTSPVRRASRWAPRAPSSTASGTPVTARPAGPSAVEHDHAKRAGTHLPDAEKGSGVEQRHDLATQVEQTDQRARPGRHRR